MPAELSFQELLQRLRAGDESAATELYNRFGDAVRRVARQRIRRSRIWHRVDSVDILQSVMKSFVLRYSRPDNKWQIDTPEQLINLLLDMAGNTVTDKKRREETDKRGGGEVTGSDIVDPVGTAGPPEDLVITRELAALCLQKMSEDAKRLFRLRFEEQLEWSAIAQLEGSTSEACRNKLNRAFDSVREQMSQEGHSDV